MQDVWMDSSALWLLLGLGDGMRAGEVYSGTLMFTVARGSFTRKRYENKERCWSGGCLKPARQQQMQMVFSQTLFMLSFLHILLLIYYQCSIVENPAFFGLPGFPTNFNVHTTYIYYFYLSYLFFSLFTSRQ